MEEDFMVWCKAIGVVVDYTVLYFPQQNGRSERLNRIIMEKARAPIFEANLDKAFLGDAVYIATYLLNRSPSSIIDKTPIEMWNGKKPDKFTNLWMSIFLLGTL